MKNKSIVFDLGGVLLDLNYQLTINAFEKLGVGDFKTLYSQANQIGLFDAYETGQISTQRFINDVLNYVPVSCNPNHIVKAWNAMILDFKKEKLDNLIELRKSANLFLLSNTNALHIEKVHMEWFKICSTPFDAFFDQTYFSHRIGLRKPSVEIFDLVCRENDLTPSKTLFIDDTIQHIEGAKRAGLKTILHQQNSSLDVYNILAQFN